MPPDFSRSDLKRTPYPDQQTALNTLAEKWNNCQAFAITAPTASGKSLISRTIQLATDGAYITCNNMLVEQFAHEYKLPIMQGQEHYPTGGAYHNAVTLSLDPENHNCYNPISFRYAMKRKDFRMPKCIIIDEAHAALGLLREITTQVFRLDRNEYFRLNLGDPQKCIQWLLHITYS